MLVMRYSRRRVRFWVSVRSWPSVLVCGSFVSGGLLVVNNALFQSQLVEIGGVVLPLLHGFVLLWLMVFFMDWFREGSKPR